MNLPLEKYEAVIGLEVHVQLSTHTKLFVSDSTEFGAEPNTHISPVTLAYPGTLPVVNKKAIEMAVKMGLACNSQIAGYTFFDRKNYFYPDLPKGYQITQDRQPICNGGVVVFRNNGEKESVRLRKIHLEEDAGKLLHDNPSGSSVDFNRAGVPLIEIVTEPDIHSASSASAFMMEIRKLVRYLDISDGNMEQGSLRCDANVSVRPGGSKILGKKAEVKNINSFKFVEKALEYEISRQIELLEKGEEVLSETRNFDKVSLSTSGMRMKEELNDYRYFPDPDLSPIEITDKWLKEISGDMPPLPEELYNKLIREYDLPEYDADVITSEKELAQYFEEGCRYTSNFKSLSNWLMGPVKSYLNEESMSIPEFPVSAERLAALSNFITDNDISFTVAQTHLFPAMLKDRNSEISDLARDLGLTGQSEDMLARLVEEVLDENSEEVKFYRQGKKKLFKMFMGHVMRKSGGKANPHKVRSLLDEYLNEKQT